MARAPRKPPAARKPPPPPCVDCGAKYTAFRCGLPPAGKHLSAMIAAAGRGRTTDQAGGDGPRLTLASARRDLGRLKRAAWSEHHGIGRCVDDPGDEIGDWDIVASWSIPPPTPAAIVVVDLTCDDDDGIPITLPALAWVPRPPPPTADECPF